MAYAFINPWALTEGYHQEQDRLDKNDLEQAAEQRRQAADARTQQNFNIDMQYKPQKLQSALDSSNAQLNYYNQLALNNKNINASYEAGAPNRAAAQTISDDSNQNALAKINADKIMRDNGFTAQASTEPDFDQKFDAVVGALPPGSREATHLTNTRQSWALGKAMTAIRNPDSPPEWIIGLAAKAGVQLAPYSPGSDLQTWQETAAQQLNTAPSIATARETAAGNYAAAERARQAMMPKVQPELSEKDDGMPTDGAVKSAHTVLKNPNNHSPEVIAAARDVVMRSLRMAPPPSTTVPITPESAIDRNQPLGNEALRGNPQLGAMPPTAAQTATPPTVYNDTRRSQYPAQSQPTAPTTSYNDPSQYPAQDQSAVPAAIPPQQLSKMITNANARIEAEASQIIPKQSAKSKSDELKANIKLNDLIAKMKQEDPELQSLNRQLYTSVRMSSGLQR